MYTALFRVIQYHFKFLTNDVFENRFITAHFQDIDLNRAGKNLETVLPLNNGEKRQYIMVTFTDLGYCFTVHVVSKTANCA
jgi:hypothetical protein